MKAILLLVLLAIALPLNAQSSPHYCEINDDCQLTPCSLESACIEGICHFILAEDETYCQPQDWCASSGVCLWGECIETAQRDCSEYSGDCAVGVCNSELEQCESEYFSFGTLCDEDVPPCEHPGVCSGSHLECEYPGPLENGSECSNGLFCTVDETCHDGECVGGCARDCSHVSDACLLGVCDEWLQECVANPLEWGTPCSTGLPVGLCLDAELCDDAGTCVQYFKEEGVVCRQGDGTVCNPDESCPGDGSFCPIDQIDQSPFCRNRPLNHPHDDDDDHDHQHRDDNDDHHFDDDGDDDIDFIHEHSLWWVWLVIIGVGLILAVVLLMRGRNRSYRLGGYVASKISTSTADTNTSTTGDQKAPGFNPKV